MNESQACQAAGMLHIAVCRMAKAYPFHAHLLSPDRFVCDPAVGTMGVTIRDARVLFLYAPKFVCECTFDELVGMFHHQVNHVLFEHPIADPRKYPDREARMIAEEVSVNEWIREPLPGKPLTLEQSPDLPAGEDTDTRYGRLALEPVGGRGEPAKSVSEAAEPGPKSGRLGPKRAQSGPRKAPSGPKSGRQTEKPMAITPLDNHDVGREARLNPVLGKLVIASAVQQAQQALSQEQWASLPSEFQRLLEQHAAGTEPGSEGRSLGRG